MKEEKEKGDPFSFSLPRKASSLAHAVSIPSIQVGTNTITTIILGKVNNIIELVQVSPSPRLGVTIIKTQAAISV